MHLKKLSAEATPIMGNLENLKKNCLHSEWRKKIASAHSMVEKNFLPPENHDPHPPGGGGNNCPSLTYSTETLQADSLVKVPQNTQI